MPEYDKTNKIDKILLVRKKNVINHTATKYQTDKYKINTHTYHGPHNQ